MDCRQDPDSCLLAYDFLNSHCNHIFADFSCNGELEDSHNTSLYKESIAFT